MANCILNTKVAKIIGIFLLGLLGGITGALLSPSSSILLPSGEKIDEGKRDERFDERQAQAEEITLTTYYPSPYGVYDSMVAVRLGVGDTSGPFGSPDGKYDNLDSPPQNQPGNVWIRENVGIGTTRPTDKLTTSGNIRIRSADSRIVGLNSDSVYSLGTSGGAAIRFITNGSNDQIAFETHKTGVSHAERVRIDSLGNVGIGTGSPTQKLDAAGYVKGQTGLCIGNDCRTGWPGGGDPSVIDVGLERKSCSGPYNSSCTAECSSGKYVIWWLGGNITINCAIGASSCTFGGSGQRPSADILCARMK